MRTNKLYYVLKDHLGSASILTNTSGVIKGEDRFYPFGETRFTTGTMYTDKLFTGQREMAGLGIYHYGARFYSPKLGRFLSADTIVPNPYHPQDLNRFSYVRNNPLRYTDPTGHWIDEGCGCESNGRRTTSFVVVAGRRTRDTDGTPSVTAPSTIPTTPTTPSVLPPDPLSDTSHYGDDPVVAAPTDTDTETPPDSFTQASSEETHSQGHTTLLEGFIHFAEGMVLFGVSLVALGATARAGLVGIIVGTVVFGTTALIGLNFALFGVQEMLYAGSEREPDPIPLIHLFFPDYMR